MNTRIVYSHQSALAYWLGVNIQSWSAPKVARSSPLDESYCSCSEVCDCSSSNILLGPQPFHILTSSNNLKSHSKHVVMHVCKNKMPPKMFYKIDAHRYVVSPELCFVQMAKELTLPQLVEQGAVLSARYYIRPEDQLLIQRDTSVTSPRRLARTLQELSYMHGIKKAAKALKWIIPNAESPMEIKSALLLSLPYRYGGYSFPLPTANKEIVISGVLRSTKNVVRPDLAWPAKRVIVEYDGKDYHQDAHRDKHRSNMLESLGWHVFYITKQELLDTLRFDALAMQIARRLGVRVRKPGGWEHEHAVLRSQILHN